MEYFANPGKVGKELDGELTRTVRFQNGRVRKCPTEEVVLRSWAKRSDFGGRFSILFLRLFADMSLELL